MPADLLPCGGGRLAVVAAAKKPASGLLTGSIGWAGLRQHDYSIRFPDGCFNLLECFSQADRLPPAARFARSTGAYLLLVGQ
jgi:dienelactone hydrolase